MAKVSLRSYNRDIEALIENEQVAEAVAHCQHILRTFPKHLETYRLLGKAYLEARRYADAADIFQRVLMAVPDDFVSHVGMSIIRDDEKKLDEAIWHMERAFEAQPSNAAVQGELRRLYGRRDGMEPPKIRMTRGALAHMYLQGQLYSQAIAEIRAVLADEPQRVDMQALLARAYFFGGHRVETTELCTTLLKKFPYSLEANRIMVEILPSTGRAESTQVYRHRVNQLDPYATFATGSIFELAAVPDAAVNLERLEYEPGQAELLESGWASSLGINLESERSDAPPAWLKPSAYEEEVTPPALPAATPNTSDDIPDFLREAGWKPSTGEFKEGPLDLSEEAGESESPELTPADIPDWLQNMAPEESEPDKVDQADLDFLSTAKPAALSEDIPDWLKNAAPVEATEPAMRNAPDQDATPDWLTLEEESPSKLEPGTDTVLPAWEAAPAGGEGEGNLEIPDWLGDLSAGEPGAEKPGMPIESDEFEVAAAAAAVGLVGSLSTSEEEHEESLSWLQSLAAKQSEDSGAEESVSAEPAVEVPDWLGEMPAIEQAVSPEEPAPSAPPVSSGIADLGTSADEQDAALAWLESLAAKQGANEEELLIKPEERLESAPEWVDKFQAVAGETTPMVQPEPEEPAVPMADLPSWLTEEPEAEKPPIEAEEPAASAVSGIGELGTSTDEQDAALAWLESLAAKQGANEEELLVKPEDRLESAPEWVDKAQAASLGPAETKILGTEETTFDWFEEPSPEEPSLADTQETRVSEPTIETPLGESAPGFKEEQPEPELPLTEEPAAPVSSGIADLGTSADEQDAALAWLESLAAKQGANEEELLIKPEERLEAAPEWVDKFQAAAQEAEAAEPAAEQPSAEIPAEGWPELEIEAEEPFAMLTPETAAPAAGPEDDLTDWLQELDQAETEPPTPAAEESEVSFDWLKEDQPSREEMGSVTDWLHSLDEQGKPQAEAEPVPAVETKIPDLPTWLKEGGSAGIADEDLPDWLRGDEETPVSAEPTAPSEWQPQAETPAVEESPAPVSFAAETPAPAEPAKPAVDEPAPPRASTPIPTMRRTGMLGPTKDILLLEAQTELQRGNLQAALDAYGKMIKKNRLLDEVIYDLREATYRYPVDVTIWQTLGDAYMRSNRLQDALDAYTKAEELLR